MIKDQQFSEPSLGRVKESDASAEVIWIELAPRADRLKVCGGCHKPAEALHDREERWIQDLPLFDTPVELLVHRCRVRCENCGTKLEHLAWLAPYQRVTQRLALSVARLCRRLPIKHVAEYFDLHWETVKSINKAQLDSTLPQADLSNLEVIAIDDFAIRKGHQHAG